MALRDLFIVKDEAEIERMLGWVRLGALITHGPQGLSASHIPWLYDPARRCLVAHVSRQNPQPALDGGGEAMALFLGPDAYITPSWYPSKQEHGRVAPTWNYESLTAYGTLTWIEDRARIVEIVSALTAKYEAQRGSDWAVSDAPADYVEKLSNAIIGLELAVTRVEAKRVYSQQRNEADRAGAIAGLQASGLEADAIVARRIIETNDH